jgi:hypothetical protein
LHLLCRGGAAAHEILGGREECRVVESDILHPCLGPTFFGLFVRGHGPKTEGKSGLGQFTRLKAVDDSHDFLQSGNVLRGRAPVVAEHVPVPLAEQSGEFQFGGRAVRHFAGAPGLGDGAVEIAAKGGAGRAQGRYILGGSQGFEFLHGLFELLLAAEAHGHPRFFMEIILAQGPFLFEFLQGGQCFGPAEFGLEECAGAQDFGIAGPQVARAFELQPSHPVVALLEALASFTGKVAGAPTGEEIVARGGQDNGQQEQFPRMAQDFFPATSASSAGMCAGHDE